MYLSKKSQKSSFNPNSYQDQISYLMLAASAINIIFQHSIKLLFLFIEIAIKLPALYTIIIILAK